MTNQQIPILIRPAKPNDSNFISSSWVNSYHDSLDNPMRFRNKCANCLFTTEYTSHVKYRYFLYQEDLITRLLSRSILLVAANPEDEDQIFGYMVFEHNGLNILHWLYTKHTYRHFGIASHLLSLLPPSQFPLVLTHRGPSLAHYHDGEPTILTNLLGRDYVFKPELAFERTGEEQ